MWVETKDKVKKIWAEAKELVEPFILPPVMKENGLGSVDKIVVFLDGQFTKNVVVSNRNEFKKEVNLWVDTKEQVEEIWANYEEVLEPLSSLTEKLEESTASFNQMDVRNITETDVDLDQPPTVLRY